MVEIEFRVRLEGLDDDVSTITTTWMAGSESNPDRYSLLKLSDSNFSLPTGIPSCRRKNTGQLRYFSSRNSECVVRAVCDFPNFKKAE